MKELYLKTRVFEGGSEFVLFEEDEDREASYVSGGYRYEWLDNLNDGDKLYTIHQDDAEGNFADSVLYYDADKAVAQAVEDYESQDEDTIIPYYVLEWTLNGDDFDCDVIWKSN